MNAYKRKPANIVEGHGVHRNAFTDYEEEKRRRKEIVTKDKEEKLNCTV